MEREGKPVRPVRPARSVRAARPKRRGRPPGPHAAYREVYRSLRRRLQKGEWPQGRPLPSLRQLAAEYGVGVQVIRLALKTLREEDRIALTPRRQAIAKNQGYVVSATSNLVALILGHGLAPHWQNPEFAALQRGIESAMGAVTDPLLIVHDHRLTTTVPPDLLDLPVNGLLLFGQFQKAVLRRYQQFGVPAVLVDHPPPKDGRLSSVSVANEEAAFEATSRLIALGHRRIAFLRFVQLRLRDLDADTKERERGYRRALSQAGLKVPRGGIVNTFPQDRPSGAAVRAVLEADPPFTAALAVDAGRGRLLMEGAAALGRSVPRHFSMACFQMRAPSGNNWSGPRIAFDALGRRAVEVLYQSGRGPRHVRVPARWVEGKTVAPPYKGTE